MLGDLPQQRRLHTVVGDLWRDPAVAALWLGGSLARGAGDAHSDVDLRIAVLVEAFDTERLPAAAEPLKAAAVAILPLRFGGKSVLFHMLLEDGEIYDLLVQTTERPPSDETRLVLACRDPEFGDQLAAGEDPALRVQPADGEVIREVIVTFWISQRKHQKVLYRGLPLVAWQGEHFMRQLLLRLWYVAASGDDCGPLERTTIHTLSPVMRTVQEAMGERALAVAGLPARTVPELLDATTRLCDEVAQVGRQLAGRFGFDYPEAAEETVRQTWRRFRQDLE